MHTILSSTLLWRIQRARSPYHCRTLPSRLKICTRPFSFQPYHCDPVGHFHHDSKVCTRPFSFSTLRSKICTRPFSSQLYHCSPSVLLYFYRLRTYSYLCYLSWQTTINTRVLLLPLDIVITFLSSLASRTILFGQLGYAFPLEDCKH